MMGLAGLLSEIKEIREGANKIRYIFKREKYEQALGRIHIDLVKQLSHTTVSKEKKSCNFDETSGILTVSDHKMEFSRTTKQFEVLRVIFKEKEKDWQLSEIAEQMDKYDKEWKKLYNLIDAIKKKVQIKTGVKNLFITTTQSVFISKDYI